jgi:hypothetical protein
MRIVILLQGTSCATHVQRVIVLLTQALIITGISAVKKIHTVINPVLYIMTSNETFSPSQGRILLETASKLKTQANTGCRDNTIWFNACDVVECEAHVRTMQRLEIALVPNNTLASKSCIQSILECLLRMQKNKGTHGMSE